MATEERLEQLERSLQQAGNALQAANYRISSLETAAGTTTSAASMVDMRVLGKPSIFAGDAASWKSWSFVMLSFSAAVSPEQRTLMEKARTTATDMLNVNLTAPEQVWSRQLYYMLCLSTSGEAQRRLQNVPEGEGAGAWKVFSEHESALLVFVTTHVVEAPPVVEYIPTYCRICAAVVCDDTRGRGASCCGVRPTCSRFRASEVRDGTCGRSSFCRRARGLRVAPSG